MGCRLPDRQESIEDAIGLRPAAQEDGYRELTRFKVPSGLLILYEIDQTNSHLFGYMKLTHDLVSGWEVIGMGEVPPSLPSRLWAYNTESVLIGEQEYAAAYGQIFTESINQINVIFDNSISKQVFVTDDWFAVISEGSTQVCEIIALSDTGDEIVSSILSKSDECKKRLDGQ